jgi:hypothetical protein
MDFLKIRHRQNKKPLFEKAFFGNLNASLCYLLLYRMKQQEMSQNG